jgi:hypothetical protein
VKSILDEIVIGAFISFLAVSIASLGYSLIKAEK